MPGVVPNLTAPLSPADGANGLNSSANSASTSGQQGFTPLLSSLLAASPHSGQSSFSAAALDLHAAQALPPEGQLLPPSGALDLAKQVGKEAALNGDVLNGTLPQQLSEIDPLTPDSSQFITSQLPGLQEGLSRSPMSSDMNSAGALAVQVSGQGQQRLQQEMLIRQLALSPVADGEDPLLQGQVASLNPDTLTASDQSRLLMGLMRDALLVRQPSTNVNGGEARISENFNSALGALSALSGDAKATTDTRGVMQGSINTHFSQQGDWAEEMGSRVKWMVNSQVHSAELKMNPAQLGPIEVKISVLNDQTTVMFTAQNGAVREAIDTAIPRLREMLGDNGMNLVDVDVSDKNFAQQEQANADDSEQLEGQYAEHDGENSDSSANNGSEESPDEGSVLLSARRIVDFYA